MRKIPPLLPAETLRRVLRIARSNGTSILLVSGTLALFSAAGHDQVGTIVGLLVAGAGAIELHGAGLLAQADDRGIRWLVGGEAFLLLSVLGYVSYRTTHVDLTFINQLVGVFPEDIWKQQLAQAGLTDQEFKLQLYALFNFLMSALSLVYQGGMMIYYSRRRQAVATALAHVQE